MIIRASKAEPESRCPELLANYCDLLLRKSSINKKLTSSEIEERLKDVVHSFNQIFIIDLIKIDRIRYLI